MISFGGAADWLATLLAALLAAAVEEEPEVRPPTLGAATVGADGTPLLVPPVEMLLAFRTAVAAMFRLPVERMPASPASTTPCGAIKSTSPGSTPSTVANTPIPPPVARPAKSVSKAADCGSMRTRVGGADCTVLEETPAAISPVDDQMTIFPPRRVKIRPIPMLTSSLAKMLMLPPDSVTMPGGIGFSPVPLVEASSSLPPGIAM